MMNLSSKKAALVTGASNGIGLELAKSLLSDNWVVFGTGRDVVSLENTKKLFPRFIPIQSDFTRNEDLLWVAEVIKESGLLLHLSVHNAGVMSPPRPLIQYDCESIDEVFQVNLLAPMKLIALLTSQMPEQARILFITSRASNVRLEECSTYCASKAGLDEVTAIVRKELEEKILVYLVLYPVRLIQKCKKF